MENLWSSASSRTLGGHSSPTRNTGLEEGWLFAEGGNGETGNVGVCLNKEPVLSWPHSLCWIKVKSCLAQKLLDLQAIILP